ncbi:MAG TPA: AlkA N-terminal domain-containing protein [Stellaceae bacterium]|nr:AlkA N-terminal domain-containing protein [Stellaceae bacterium]
MTAKVQITRMELDPDICYRALAARDPRFDGRFFVAVSTTGIYCRPICPARTPYRDNCTFYSTAAAAQEAGYRPCLRCRPETAPSIGAWRGTSNTVSRALVLIESGALDDGDVEALAARLGVGGRQLRRLFQEHLGASPLAVAQTRRILLAKQLIHETGLPMTEVAMAAGFGSTRRFNDTFQRLFDRPPSALRRRGAGRDGSTLELTLAYKPPYDWDAILGFLAARAIPGVETVSPQCYRRTFAHGTLAVSHEPERRRLRIALRLGDVGALPSILLRVRRVFDLGADPESIAAHLSGDPLLAPLVARRPGLRLPGGWDGFEMAVRAVIGQQITIAGARNLLGKLVAAYGVPISGGAEGLTHVFPSPEHLVDAEIAALGMPGARGRAISSMARAALADPSLFERAASLDEAIEKLCAVPGIGDWTAHYIAIRALREPDGFPASDIGLLRALAEEGVRPSPKQVLVRAEAWRPWRAYAAQHLWTHDFAQPPARKGKKIETLARKIAVADRNDPARL